jgi:hypothetical protein
MSKRVRYERSANDLTIAGYRAFIDDDDKEVVYVFRKRKARRAQARLDGLNWRELDERERLHQ